jgi:3-hydroxybutyryl-CoA dehydrogenase
MNPRLDIQKVGIVGCGQMGSGYVQLCTLKGYRVIVSEVDDVVLNKGLALIKSRLTEGVSQGQLSGTDKDLALSQIKGTTNLQDFSDCDLVIEAATERMEVKKEIFADLDKVCPEDVVLGTNTSVLSVLDIAMATTRPQNVVGIHMNPLMMPAAEIIRTVVTSDETVEVARIFSQSLDKTCIIAPDIPGFIGNRLITPLLLSAIWMVESNIASKEDIDTTFTVAFGWPMGPLAMADVIGLDTLLLGTNAMYEELREPQFVPPVMLRKMVTAGWLGCKTGKGFYEYDR